MGGGNSGRVRGRRHACRSRGRRRSEFQFNSTGIRLESDWNRAGIRLESDWNRAGIGVELRTACESTRATLPLATPLSTRAALEVTQRRLESDWNPTGIRLESDWNPTGFRLEFQSVGHWNCALWHWKTFPGNLSTKTPPPKKLKLQANCGAARRCGRHTEPHPSSLLGSRASVASQAVL
jgi:hypothetical protein